MCLFSLILSTSRAVCRLFFPLVGFYSRFHNNDFIALSFSLSLAHSHIHIHSFSQCHQFMSIFCYCCCWAYCYCQSVFARSTFTPISNTQNSIVPHNLLWPIQMCERYQLSGNYNMLFEFLLIALSGKKCFVSSQYSAHAQALSMHECWNNCTESITCVFSLNVRFLFA